MLIELFKRTAKSKWLPWVGLSPFLVMLVSVMFAGEQWRGLGLLAFFGSMFLGILLGNSLGRLLNTHVLKLSPDFGKRLAAALSGFGFLFLPPVVGSWSNVHLGTEIRMSSLGMHFLWACVGGAIFFCAKPSATEE